MQASATRGNILSEVIGASPVIIFAVLLFYISLNAPNFVTFMNLKLILMQSLPVVLICVGLSAVVMAGGDDVVSGGIDLSIPATAVLCAGIIAGTITTGTPLFLAALYALIAAFLIGSVNALLVTRIGMTPLLTSLSMSVAVVGINNMVTQSRRINISNETILALRDGSFLGVPLGIWVVGLIVLICYHLLHRTKWGLNLQAVGGSRDAAEISGLKTSRLISHSFIMAALLGFVTSFFVLARGSGSSPGVQDNLMLEMVLATFLGAAFSPRRVVTMWGAVLGAILVAAISIGFKSMGVNVFWTGLIKGSMIVVVVAMGAVSQRVQR